MAPDRSDTTPCLGAGEKEGGARDRSTTQVGGRFCRMAWSTAMRILRSTAHSNTEITSDKGMVFVLPQIRYLPFCNSDNFRCFLHRRQYWHYIPSDTTTPGGIFQSLRFLQAHRIKNSPNEFWRDSRAICSQSPSAPDIAAHLRPDANATRDVCHPRVITPCGHSLLEESFGCHSGTDTRTHL
jgi:hypothetical protein